MIHGPRQSGKSTLARTLAEERRGSYVSLDDPGSLRVAKRDPLTFLTSRPFPLAVDEIQRGGDHLVRTIKRLVDQDPAPGRFLLTGSSNFLTVPTISESLAGRARIFRLWPFSEAELAQAPAPVFDGWFDSAASAPEPVDRIRFGASDRHDYLTRACRGGYPAALRLNPRQRAGWFDSYVETVTQRDLPELADIRRVAALPSLMSWVSAASGTEINVSAAARHLAVQRQTLTTYLDWLRMVFLIHEAPSWSRNLARRAVRRPKLHVTDTGLAAAQLGLTAEKLAPPDATATGKLLESFVFNEIVRQASAAPERLLVHHYRSKDHEVDLVVEDPRGALLAIEVKATSSPHPRQLRSLAWFRDRIDAVQPGTFRAGYLLHTGPQALELDDRLYCMPISALWTPRSTQLTLT